MVCSIGFLVLCCISRFSRVEVVGYWWLMGCCYLVLVIGLVFGLIFCLVVVGGWFVVVFGCWFSRLLVRCWFLM